MGEVLDFLIQWFGDQFSIPWVKWVSGAMGSIALVYRIKIVENARIINAKSSQRAKDLAEKKRDESISKKAGKILYSLKNNLYKNVSEYVVKAGNKGIKRLPVDLRGKTNESTEIESLRANYNAGLKSIRHNDTDEKDIAKDRLIDDVTDIFNKEFHLGHKRVEAIEKEAKEYRLFYFSQVHKVSGVEKGIVHIEDKHAGDDYFCKMFEELLTEVEMSNNIYTREREDIDAKNRVRTLNIKQVYNTVFPRREK